MSSIFKRKRRKTGSRSWETKTYNQNGGITWSRSHKDVDGVIRTTSHGTKRPGKTRRTITRRKGNTGWFERWTQTTGITSKRTSRRARKATFSGTFWKWAFILFILALILR